MTAARFGVCSFGPTSLTVVQATGDHATDAAVLCLDDIFWLEATNVGALSVAWPWIVSEVASELTSSTLNCTYALSICTPCGMATPLKRIPTVWLLPS